MTVTLPNGWSLDRNVAEASEKEADVILALCSSRPGRVYAYLDWRDLERAAWVLEDSGHELDAVVYQTTLSRMMDRYVDGITDRDGTCADHGKARGMLAELRAAVERLKGLLELPPCGAND